MALIKKLVRAKVNVNHIEQVCIINDAIVNMISVFVCDYRVDSLL